MSGAERRPSSRRETREDLLEKVVREARKSPRFRDLVKKEMDRLARKPDEKAPTPRSGRRDPGVLDPFAVYREEGDEELRKELGALDLKELKDIVAEHGMDQARLAMKWRNPERLVDLIATTVRERLSKGRAFGPE